MGRKESYGNGLTLVVRLCVLLVLSSSGLRASENDVIYPTIRFPLTFDGNHFTTPITLGTPKTALTMVVDTTEEGLRVSLFNDLEATSTAVITPQPKSLAVQLDTTTSDETGVLTSKRDWKSSSTRFCTSTVRCDTPSNTYNTHYLNCSETTSDINDAHFYTYVLPSDASFAPSKFPSGTIFCERHAEGTDVVTLTVDYSNGTTLSQDVGNVPVKLLTAVFPCVGSSVIDPTLNARAPDADGTQFPADIPDDHGRPLSRSDVAVPSSHPIVRNGTRESAVRGVLGISGLSCRQPSLLQAFLAAVPPLDSLQLDLTSENPELRLIASASLPKGLITWSESQQHIDLVNGMYQLQGYYPTVCGVELGFNDSSHWSVVINPNVAGLALPATLWDALVSWIPVECSSTGSPQCTLMPHVLPSSLPSLSLRLRQLPSGNRLARAYQTDDAPSIAIPLGSLFSPSGVMCIDRLYSENNVAALPEPSALESAIQLGRKSLAHFVVTLNTANHSVGFYAPNPSHGQASDIVCNPRASCLGQQTYFAPRNVCMDPDCSHWLFKTLNPTTRVCDFSAATVITFFSGIAALVIVNLYADWFYWKTLRYAKAQAH